MRNAALALLLVPFAPCPAGDGAQLPRECEGDLPCSAAWLARTDARYLARAAAAALSRP